MEINTIDKYKLTSASNTIGAVAIVNEQLESDLQRYDEAVQLAKQLHQRVYTLEQRLNMMSNFVQVQNLKLHLLEH